MRSTTVAAVLVLLLAGCGAGGPAGTPSTAPVDARAAGFSGQLLVAATPGNPQASGSPYAVQGGLWRLSIGAGDTVQAVLVVPDKGLLADRAWQESPDGHWLAYGRDNTIVLRDLTTGQERTLTDAGTVTSYDAACTSWSPDGRRLLVHNSQGPVVVGLDGTKIQLDQYDSASYASDGTRGSGQVYFGEISCGAWLGPDRVVLQRLGRLPEHIPPSQPVAQKIPADTTTLAVIEGGTVRLVDSADRWDVVDTCGARVVTQPMAEAGEVHLLDHPSDATLTTAGGPLSDGTAIPGTRYNPNSLPRDDNVHFVPGDCRLLTAQTDGFHEIDPATRATRERPLLTKDANSPLLDGAAWWSQGGHPKLAQPQGGRGVQLTDIATNRTIDLTADVDLDITRIVGRLV